MEIRILASNDNYVIHNSFANDCLKYFAFEFGEIYGTNHLIYCVHNLVHLAGDCLIHGPLDSFSAFPFETYLGIIIQVTLKKYRLKLIWKFTCIRSNKKNQCALQKIQLRNW